MAHELLYQAPTHPAGQLPLRAAYQALLRNKSAAAADCKFVMLADAYARLSKQAVGLDACMVGQKVAIVGAGVAGLYSALRLLQSFARVKDLKQKIQITIFEANTEEGGRLFTHHFNPTSYCDIGGMRLPPHHVRVHALIKELQEVYNKKLDLVPYVLSNPNARVCINGITKSKGEADALFATNPAEMGFGSVIPSLINGNLQKADGTFYTPGEIKSLALEGPLKDLQDAFDSGVGANGPALTAKFQELATQGRLLEDPKNPLKRGPPLDSLSLKQFMLLSKDEGGMGWDASVVAYSEAFTDQTNAFNVSYMEQLADEYEFSADDYEGRNWQCIDGGLQNLSTALREVLQEHFAANCKFEFSTRVVEVSEPDNNDDSRTTLYGVRGVQGDGRRPPGANAVTLPPLSEVPATANLGAFDKVLLALPPSAVRSMVVPSSWEYLAREAIRALRYDPIRKIGVLFKTRWWENPAKCNPPIRGGQSITDLPSRWIVYPSQGIGSSAEGGLLCYCWSTDAYTHLTLSPEERVQQALRDLTKVHGDVVMEQYVPRSAFPWEWSLSFAGGIAFFFPGQWQRYYAQLQKNQGNVYFAGEHISIHHAWIEGSLESSDTALSQMFANNVAAVAAMQRKVVPAAVAGDTDVEAFKEQKAEAQSIMNSLFREVAAA